MNGGVDRSADPPDRVDYRQVFTSNKRTIGRSATMARLPIPPTASLCPRRTPTDQPTDTNVKAEYTWMPWGAAAAIFLLGNGPRCVSSSRSGRMPPQSGRSRSRYCSPPLTSCVYNRARPPALAVVDDERRTAT